VTRLESDYYSYMDFDPEHTREVLRHYVPMFEDKSPVLELGCGRGEFLGLLDAAGIKAQGVDSDEGMVDAARRVGLDVPTSSSTSTPARSASCWPGSAGCWPRAAASWP
jgi:trans-aconitate methyltransferase